VSEVPNYPVNLVLAGRPVLVVGGGNVAERKVAGLVRAGANVTVVAPQVLDSVRSQDRVRVFERRYERGEVASYRLAVTCTDDPDVNAQVFRDAEAAGVWANSADDPANCAFTLPSVTRQGDLSIAVSTAGRSPALATWLRRRFSAEFDERYLDLLDVLSEVRAEAREQRGTSEIDGWNDALDGGVFDLVAQGQLDDARSALRSHLGLQEPVS
jgi:precorrin-2 dehydrogenase/sirohydrochlorin ferrochelatase